MRLNRGAWLLLWMAMLPATGWANDWRSFRGAQGSSRSNADGLPTEWDVESGQNIAWRADLPGRGVSGPIVVGGQVIVTASSGPKRDRLHVLSIDSRTGARRWHRQFWATGRTQCHPTSANAAPTPASDGERVFAFYSSNDLVALDLEGNLLWLRGLVLDHPGLGNDFGMASSPVIAGDVVVVQCETPAVSFAAAYDRQTGEERWRLERPRDGNWASPIALTVRHLGEPTPAVVLQSGESVAAHAAADGALLWQVPLACSSIPSTSAGEGTLYVPGEDGVTALATDADHPGKRTLWNQSALKPGNPSPVVAADQLLVVNRAGVLASASLETGETKWRKRLGGRFWATPVVAGNHLYAANEAGEVFVVDLATEQVVAENRMGEDVQVLGSPAVGDGALYIRSHDHLWKIATE